MNLEPNLKTMYNIQTKSALLSTGSRQHFTVKLHPPLFVTQGRSILDIAISPYSIHHFFYLFSLFYFTGEPTDGDNPGGVTNTSNGPQLQKRQLELGLSPFLDKGVIPKITAVDPTVATTVIFLPFSSFLSSTRMVITFSHLTSQVSVCLYIAPPPPHHRPPRPNGTAIGTLNIWYDRGYRLAHSIRAV